MYLAYYYLQAAKDYIIASEKFLYKKLAPKADSIKDKDTEIKAAEADAVSTLVSFNDYSRLRGTKKFLSKQTGRDDIQKPDAKV
jgi:hypothetical protein